MPNQLYDAMHASKVFSRYPNYFTEHPLYSPMLIKRKDPLSFTITAPLPKTAIFDWRQQLRTMVMFLSNKLCVNCGKSDEQAVCALIFQLGYR